MTTSIEKEAKEFIKKKTVRKRTNTTAFREYFSSVISGMVASGSFRFGYRDEIIKEARKLAEDCIKEEERYTKGQYD